MKTISKYVRENVKYWLIALALAIAYSAFAGSEEARAASPKAQVVKTGEFTFELHDQNGYFSLSDTWMRASIKAQGEFKGQPVYLILGETGGFGCEQNWVIIMTSKNYPDTKVWKPNLCYTETFSFEIGTHTLTFLTEDGRFDYKP